MSCIGSWEQVRAVLVVVITLAVALGFQQQANAAHGPWILPADDLSATGENASNPQVAVAPDGSTTVVWQRGGVTSVIDRAQRPVGGTWGSAIEMGESMDSALPQVAYISNQSTLFVYRTMNNGDWRIRADVHAPGGDTSHWLSDSGQDADTPRVVVAPDGTATVVWNRSNGSNNIIQSSTRRPNGAFPPPDQATNLSATGQSAFQPQLAVAPDGTTTVVWQRYNGSHYVIQSSTRPSNGTFPPPNQAVDLSEAGQNAFQPQVAVAPDGTTTAVWQRSNGSNRIVQASTRPPDGSFPPPDQAVDLSEAGQSADTPQVAVAPDGTATVVWHRFDGSNQIVQASTRTPNGEFPPPDQVVDLSAAGQDAGDPRVTVAPDGTTTAVWRRNDGSHHIIQSATRPPNGTFPSPDQAVDLSAAGQSALDPRVVAASDGTTTAVWRRNNGSHFIIQAASTSPLPTVTLPNVTPPQGVALFDGKRLRIRLKCPGQFKPACRGHAQAVTRRPGKKMSPGKVGRKVKPMSSRVKVAQKAGRSKVLTLMVKPKFRKKVRGFAKTPGKKRLVVRQLISAKKLADGRRQAVYQRFRVRPVKSWK